MSYFSNFPNTVYEINGRESIVLDILRRSMFISEYRPYTDLFELYTIQDGETPQSIAMDFYKSANYHWVVMLCNEIHNPYFDWPMNQLDLERYCQDKYGDAMYQTKHHEIDNIVVGNVKEFKKGVAWIPPIFIGTATAISFYDYEQQLNDAKRDISILRPELIGDFITQFQESING